MGSYAGSEWIQASLFFKRDLKMSQIGRDVADLLGELVYGIYHLDPRALRRVDWTNPHHIEMVLPLHSLATADFDELTRLVFLAHHRAIRVEIQAATHRYFRLIFHQRERGIGTYRHLSLDQAVAQFKATVSVPETDAS